MINHCVCVCFVCLSKCFVQFVLKAYDVNGNVCRGLLNQDFFYWTSAFPYSLTIKSNPLLCYLSFTQSLGIALLPANMAKINAIQCNKYSKLNDHIGPLYLHSRTTHWIVMYHFPKPLPITVKKKKIWCDNVVVNVWLGLGTKPLD